LIQFDLTFLRSKEEESSLRLCIGTELKNDLLLVRARRSILKAIVLVMEDFSLKVIIGLELVLSQLLLYFIKVGNHKLRNQSVRVVYVLLLQLQEDVLCSLDQHGLVLLRVLSQSLLSVEVDCKLLVSHVKRVKVLFKHGELLFKLLSELHLKVPCGLIQRLLTLIPADVDPRLLDVGHCSFVNGIDIRSCKVKDHLTVKFHSIHHLGFNFVQHLSP
jgi:hypothetical protein